MDKLERLAPIAVICAVLGCGSSTPPTESPQSSQPPSEPASAESSPDMPPSSTPESSTPESSASTQSGKREGDDGRWEGEKEAANKPVERTAAETRTTEVIQKVVLDHRKSVRECYDKARKELPDIKGKMTIKFVLDPDGKVKLAELVLADSEVKAPAVVNCAIDILKKIKFPPSSRGMDTTVAYPFDFKPQGGGRP